MEKREEMVLLMEEFANSGQTQKEFSASKGMGVHKFNYWSRKLKNEKEQSSGFVRVETVTANSGAGEQLELLYPTHHRIPIPGTGSTGLVSSPAVWLPAKMILRDHFFTLSPSSPDCR